MNEASAFLSETQLIVGIFLIVVIVLAVHVHKFLWSIMRNIMTDEGELLEEEEVSRADS